MPNAIRASRKCVITVWTWWYLHFKGAPPTNNSGWCFYFSPPCRLLFIVMRAPVWFHEIQVNRRSEGRERASHLSFCHILGGRFLTIRNHSWAGWSVKRTWTMARKATSRGIVGGVETFFTLVTLWWYLFDKWLSFVYLFLPFI